MVTFVLSAIGVIDVGWLAYVIVGLELFLVFLKLLQRFVKRESKFGKFLVIFIPALYAALDDIGGKKDGNTTEPISDGEPNHTESKTDGA